MCGIAGVLTVDPDLARAEPLTAFVETMTSTLRHRGPDDSGLWTDAESGVGLGHRRLSIIDLSANGQQPMVSLSGRLVIIFNGEIYNHRHLRKRLEAANISFRGHSDTEVLVNAIEQWGLEAALEQCVGMFAFALWDRRDRTLRIVRDRLGEKPLYYGWWRDSILFASELKAINRIAGNELQIDRAALTLFLRFGYVPEPYSIYQNIFKLPPGCVLTLNRADAGNRARFSAKPPATIGNGPGPTPYWSLKTAAESGLARQSASDREAELIEGLDARLKQALHDQMVADVPVGAFLSGGIDSTAVVGALQSIAPRPVRTFTIGFAEREYDEAEYAKRIAEHLGTDHTELYVTARDALETVPELPNIYDEPFADASQIPTYLVSKLARTEVTVCLSGDGGDELFLGYNRYHVTDRVWKRFATVPDFVKGLIARGLTVFSPETWDTINRLCGFAIPRNYRQRNLGDKLYKLSDNLREGDIVAMYRSLMSYWREPQALVMNSEEPATILSKENCLQHNDDVVNDMMYWDQSLYLPSDNLVKGDRASMAVSLEMRLPLLDHRLVEYAWQVPLAYKYRHGQTKWLLRQVLYKYVPRELVERPKTGFSVPVGFWLRGPLRDWAETLLSEDRLESGGILDPGPIRQRWREHLSGKRNWQLSLWAVLMFQAWREKQAATSNERAI